MIYVTGDIHGYIDIRKFLDNDITEQITEKDYVIICGDFGLIWNYKRETGKERKWLKWLNERRWTTLFVDGNHECFPRLNGFPVKEWNGGKVHVIRDRVLHLMRGEVFEIEGNKIFAMGGAGSHDRGPAKGDTKVVEGRFWWPEEIPSKEEMENGLRNLEKHNWKVDYVITHCLPTTFNYIVKKGAYKPDAITDYHEMLRGKLEFKHWYSGHYHYDLDVIENVSVIFTRIIRIGETILNSETMLGVPKYRTGDTVLYKPGNDVILGVIKNTLPFGTMFKHEEPYYEIIPAGQEDKKKFDTVMESQIVEKSLTDWSEE